MQNRAESPDLTMTKMKLQTQRQLVKAQKVRPIDVPKKVRNIIQQAVRKDFQTQRKSRCLLRAKDRHKIDTKATSNTKNRASTAIYINQNAIPS